MYLAMTPIWRILYMICNASDNMHTALSPHTPTHTHTHIHTHTLTHTHVHMQIHTQTYTHTHTHTYKYTHTHTRTPIIRTEYSIESGLML